MTLVSVSPMIALLLAGFAFEGCSDAPGRPRPGSEVVPPDKILDADLLYAKNCAGCHGLDGTGGIALALANPAYLAVADDVTIRGVASSGVPGTMMPAFAESSGGMLTDEQINVLVSGMRTRWAKSNAPRAPNSPPYKSATAGDPQRGENAFNFYCASCHGANGHGSARAGSIVDRAYLALVSDQSLRTTIVAGRPEIGSPDWSSCVRGQPMSSQDVSDVVAWLAAQRLAFPGPPSSSVQSQAGGVR